MIATTSLPVAEDKRLQMTPMVDPELEHHDDFTNRARIALLEPDPTLRAVIVRSLLRMGCVVTFKRTLAQVSECLRAGTVHGALVAWELNAEEMTALNDANVNRVPVVVLTETAPPPPGTAARDPLRFLQKPFDMRELFTQLNLTQAPKVLNIR